MVNSAFALALLAPVAGGSALGSLKDRWQVGKSLGENLECLLTRNCIDIERGNSATQNMGMNEGNRYNSRSATTARAVATAFVGGRLFTTASRPVA